MKRKLNQSSILRGRSFTWLKGLLLLVILQLAGSSPTMADTKNAADYFKVTHNPTKDEPYIEWEYIDWDFNGIDDGISSSTFYIGWNGSGGDIQIMHFTGTHANLVRYNTTYGAGYPDRTYTSNDKRHVVVRFYPSSVLGCGPGSALGKNFYIRMVSAWDIDHNGSNDYAIDKKINPDCSAYYSLQATPDVTFSRGGKNKINASIAAGGSAASWGGGICFTQSTSTQTTDIYYKNELGNGSIGSNGSMSQTIIFTDVENAPVTIYYHRYGEKRVTVGSGCNELTDPEDVTVRQLIDGGLKSYTFKGFQEPLGMTGQANKYTQTVTLNWSNGNSGRDTDGKNAIFRMTDDGSYTKIATLSNTTTTYEDKTAYVGHKYEYKVMFIPTSYGNVTQPDLTSNLISPLNGHKIFTQDNSYNVNLTAEYNETSSSIVLNWSSETDENLTYKLKRYNDATKQWDNIYEGTDKYYSDNDGLVSFKTYKYRVEVPYWSSTWTKETTITFTAMTKVKDIKVSQGTYSGMVKLSWKADQKGSSETRFVVSRKTLNDPSSEYVDIYEASGTSSTYHFDDVSAQPGMYYLYRVTPYANIPAENRVNGVEWATGTYIEGDGFCQAKGIIAGRVTYGTGTAVEGVKVTLEKVTDTDSGNDDREQFYSLGTADKNGAFAWTPTKSTITSYLSGKPFTIQMWARANTDADVAPTSGKRAIMSIPGQMSLYLTTNAADADNYDVEVSLLDSEGVPTLSNTGLKVPQTDFSNISLSYDGNTTYSICVASEDEIDSVAVAAGKQLDFSNGKSVVIGGDSIADNKFIGFVDDVRVWSRALTMSEIHNNYQRILSGSESGLICYWPLDEGIKELPYVYDYSKKGGVPNGNHAVMASVATPETTIPDDDQLSLYALTDSEGSYEVRGIPFTGEGTSYIVRPSMGVHSFSPQYATRYVSTNSLTHSAVDYEDVSSFPISGTVYYANTTIPVSGAYLYVDGSLAARDGEAVTTDDNGEFKVDVPIGQHYVQVKMNGHTFQNNGRYPESNSEVTTYFTCEEAITGLTFWDQTLVTIAGRVAGGSVEEDKYLGLGLGKANIGQAVIKLQHVGNGLINAKKVTNELSVSYEANNEARSFKSATTNIESTAQVGLDNTGKSENFITITTDPTKGEWSAMVPPLRYNAISIEIPKQKDIDFSSKLFSLDATNPLVVTTDSLSEDSVFKYCAAEKIIYRSASQLDVTEGSDGTFGSETITATKYDGTTTSIQAYNLTKDDEGNVTNIDYTFGYPVYEQKKQVTYNISAYEKYVNKDGTEPDYDIVPLSDLDVTIQNQFASTTSVCITNGEVHEMEDDILTLDSEGKAKYRFTVGLPNIGGDYTRTLNISYNIDGTTYAWSGNGNFKAIVLGALPKGNNFVTDGPDKVLMILRDPPGTNSSTTWSKGTSVTSTESYSFSEFEGGSQEGTLLLGAETEISEGVGVAVIQDTESVANVEEGFELTQSEEWGNTSSTTITATRDISTSDGADFVGAVGDVFIGYATNTILGACTNVQVAENTDGQFVVTKKDAISMSEKFKTSFSYTQNYIENVLIPNFEDTRNSLLPYIGERDVTSITRPTDSPIYFSKLSEDDKNYGVSNSDKSVWGSSAKSWDKLTNADFNRGYLEGPSYYVVLPTKQNVNYSDTICYFNNQIKNWEGELAKNEMAKINCIKSLDKAWDKENFSFDAGASITNTLEADTTDVHEYTYTFENNIHLALETGFSFCGFGFETKFNKDFSLSCDSTSSDETTTTNSFSYTLAEDGDDDYLSVDVFSPAPDGFGPVFYTRGGATCAPWEDEVVAKYAKGYEGTVLQQKTLQIEKPELIIPNNIVTGVPSGKSAKLKIQLWNRSETGEDCYYGLWVNSDSNKDGLQVFMDGQNIAAGIDLLIPAGDEPVEKTLELRQTDTDILEYENVSLSFYSTSQPDDTGVFPGIYSDKSFSVYFQPSCTDIDMTASRSIVNTKNYDDVTFSMSGYDYNQATFKEIRLQYKGENDANFVTLKTFVKDTETNDPNQSTFSALSGTNKLTYKVDMSGNDFTDQTYIFRALAVGYRNGDEVTTPSDEISIVRDMSRPQLITMPTPTSGILVANDNITLTFNEDICDNLLTKTDNFVVTGAMNESEVSHDVGLSLAGSESTAKTESTIDLNKKSFSMNLWMKYTQDGRILQHGTTGCQFDASVVDGKLALTVGNKTVTSDVELPKNQWVYLAISYDNSGDTPVLNAGYGVDASSVALIKNAETDEYEGNGPIALGGNNIAATVQELSIWNEARTLTEALADKDLTKNQYTTGLIGYWQLNEGHGLTATDRSRSRNLTLTAQNAWYLNSGTNYELALDGTTSVKAEANLAALNSDSYLIETWFKAEEGENGVASILSMPDKLDIRLNSAGALELGVNDDYTTVYTDKNLYDSQWHHIAFNVLKNTNSSAILYLDGSATRQFSASSMPRLEGGFILGALSTTTDGNTTYSQHMKGAIDELRVWKGNRTAALINNYMYTRVKSTDQGLAAYYPMESRGLDAYNQVVTSPILTTLVGQGNAIYDAGSATLTPQASQLALANAPAQENVQFSYVASERQITISLAEQPYKIENCNINLTALGIQDKNGNEVNPISWTVYVSQNQLKWEENEVEAQTVSGEGLTFTAELANNSASTDVWALNNLPSWLSVNNETGALSPASSQKLKFTVDPSVAVGNYEETIYAVGSQNIETPLTIILKVIGQVPDWNPVPDAETMPVVGQLKMNGVIASDPDDMVAAFCEQKCVGMAHPAYSSRYDSYMVTMNIYGNEDMEGKTLNYKVYDASTGTIYPSVAASNNEAYTYTSSKLVGNFTAPVIFTPENKIEQDLSLDRSGWKWFSMYVTPQTNDVAAIFGDAEGKVAFVKGHTSTEGSASYSNGSWDDTMSFDPAKMYKLRATEAFTETSIGTPVSPADTQITLNSGWNWIGYPAQASNSLANAFADASPEDGDILMSQSLFAIYNGGEWVGSLTGVTPGEGYKYYSSASTTKTFKYQTPSNGGSRAKAPVKTQNGLELNCEDNMAMVAQVMKDGQTVEDAEISVYAGNELCGYSATSDEMNRHFITIGSCENSNHLTFVIRLGEDLYELPSAMTYADSKVCGTLDMPFVIDMDNTTTISGLMSGKAISKIDLYDMNGAMIRIVENPAAILNATTIGNLPSGTYLQHITYEDGMTAVVKLIK